MNITTKQVKKLQSSWPIATPVAGSSSEVAMSFGSRTYNIENTRLLLVLIGAGEALLGAAFYVAVIFFQRQSLESNILAGGFALAGSVYLALAFISIWNNTFQKPLVARGLVEELNLKGSEVLAEIDTGSGLLAKEVSAKLSRGIVISTSHRRMKQNSPPRDGTGSGGQIGAPNARQGVVIADPRSLPLRDGVLDFVANGFGVRRFRRVGDRAFVLEEMVRVVKPGGLVAALVKGSPFEASVLLRDKGMVDIDTKEAKGFAPFPANLLRARKVFSLKGTYEMGEVMEPLEEFLQRTEFSYTPRANA